jgi:hypothetical protein
MFQVLLSLSAVVLLAHAYVDDVDEAYQVPQPTYAVQWRRRALFTDAGCKQGTEYEYLVRG